MEHAARQLLFYVPCVPRSLLKEHRQEVSSCSIVHCLLLAMAGPMHDLAQTLPELALHTHPRDFVGEMPHENIPDDLRYRCSKLAMSLDKATNEVAGMQTQIREMHRVVKALAPIAGAWVNVPLEVQRLVVPFIVDVMPMWRSLAWWSYPENFVAMLGDPVLPYHPGHYLRDQLQREGYFVYGPMDEWAEGARLRVVYRRDYGALARMDRIQHSLRPRYYSLLHLQYVVLNKLGVRRTPPLDNWDEPLDLAEGADDIV